ncbi:hypothetical protein STEG23_027737 [Scotinomys teguina]
MTSHSLRSPTEMPCCVNGEQQDSATLKKLHHKKGEKKRVPSSRCASPRKGEQQAEPTVNNRDAGDHMQELLTAWRIPDQEMRQTLGQRAGRGSSRSTTSNTATDSLDKEIRWVVVAQAFNPELARFLLHRRNRQTFYRTQREVTERLLACRLKNGYLNIIEELG